MKKLYGIPIAFLFISCLASASLGYFVGGGSNLVGYRYPAFNAFEPSKPFAKDDFSLNRYKDQVQDFRDEAEQYIENAKNDIKRIQAEMGTAIDITNEVVDKYNSFIRYGY